MAPIETLRDWRARGRFSPDVAIRVVRAARLLYVSAILPVVGKVGSAFLAGQPDAAASRGMIYLADLAAWLSSPMGVVVCVLSSVLALYLSWAGRDAMARRDFLSIAEPGRGASGRMALTAGSADLRLLVPERRRTRSLTTFCSRTVRSLGQTTTHDAVSTVLEAWGSSAEEARRGIAVIGPAGMGKTRLIQEASARLRPSTILLVPRTANVQGDVRHILRYSKNKTIAVLFDDLQYFEASASPERLIASLKEAGASRVYVAATLTKEAFDQLTSDASGYLSSFLVSMKHVELMRMSAADISALALEAGLKEPSTDCGGNPGLLLFDFNSLRAQLNAQSEDVRLVLEIIFVVLRSRITNATPQLLTELVKQVFDRSVEEARVAEILEILKQLSFLRSTRPLRPEEAYVVGLLSAADADKRLIDLEMVLRRQRDATGLAELAQTYRVGDFGDARVLRPLQAAAEYFETAGERSQAATCFYNLGLTLARLKNPLSEIEAAYRAAVRHSVALGTTTGNERAARSLMNLEIAQAEHGRPRDELTASASEAARLGRLANSCEGSQLAASALFNLGRDLSAGGAAIADLEPLYRESAEIGQAIGTAGGLCTAGRALLNLASEYAAVGRPRTEVESVYHAAIRVGRKARTPCGLEVVSAALQNIAIGRRDQGGDLSSFESIFNEAAEAGRAANSSTGSEYAANALYQLAEALARRSEPLERFRPLYLAAAEVGEVAGSQLGFVRAAKAMLNLGTAMTQSQSTPDVEVYFRKAEKYARMAGGTQGLEVLAMALHNLGIATDRAGRPIEAVVRFFDAAAAAGCQAGTAAGLELTATSLASSGAAQRARGTSLDLVESSWRAAADAGIRAGTAPALETASTALRDVALIRHVQGARQTEVEQLIHQAKDAALKSKTSTSVELIDGLEIILSRLASGDLKVTL